MISKLMPEIDKNNNDLTIGKHKYSAKSNYYKEKTITNLKNENDTTFYKYLNDIIYLDQTLIIKQPFLTKLQLNQE